MLSCQVVSQLGQVGVFPVIQLPASDAQVEPQPGRVGLFISCPIDFIVAFLLTSTLPTEPDAEEHQQTGMNREILKIMKPLNKHWRDC